MLDLDPLYFRFFGIGEDQLTSFLACQLGLNHSNDVYFTKVDRGEVVLELLVIHGSRDWLRSLIARSLSKYLIGVGRTGSLEAVVGHQLIKRHLSVTSAESLTAGQFQSLLGRVPGISSVFPGGLVTYSNQAKHRLLAIPWSVIHRYGVVSRSVAKWMALRSREIMRTDLAVSFTGVAGPASLEGHPAGTVWIGLATKQTVSARLYRLVPLARQLATFRSNSEFHAGLRNSIRLLSAKTGLKLINDELNRH